MDSNHLNKCSQLSVFLCLACLIGKSSMSPESPGAVQTCVSVSPSSAVNSALSEMDKYCFSWYFLSRLFSCWVVNGVRGFLEVICETGAGESLIVQVSTV